jgi:hypothetical protein
LERERFLGFAHLLAGGPHSGLLALHGSDLQVEEPDFRKRPRVIAHGLAPPTLPQSRTGGHVGGRHGALVGCCSEAAADRSGSGGLVAATVGNQIAGTRSRNDGSARMPESIWGEMPRWTATAVVVFDVRERLGGEAEIGQARVGRWLCRDRWTCCNGDGVAEVFELGDQAAGLPFGVLPRLEIVVAEVGENLAGTQQMPDQPRSASGRQRRLLCWVRDAV